MASTATLARWTVFNVVGALGVVVQLATLAALIHLGGLHDLAATALAVQAAVVHNFYWHQRWTWRDRPSRSWRETISRFGRFQALNGLISLAGNVAVTALLTRSMGIDPVIAGAIAIGACAVLNFTASESLVFVRGSAAAIAVLIVGAPALAVAQSQAALEAWRVYDAEVEARYRAISSTTSPFFVQDANAASQGWRDTVRKGEPTAFELQAPPAEDARIHHWAGAVFVPGLSVEQVVDRLLHHAGDESRFHEDVVQSRLMARQDDRVNVFMRLRRTTVITATFNTEHAVEYRRFGGARAASRSVATRIAEVADAGTPDEHERTPGDDHGFLWKLNAYWRFEAVEGGVLVECESLSLSRGVPLLLRPVATPIIDRVARESLQKTLDGVRRFLLTSAGPSRPIAASKIGRQ
jgi:putative flippase GtrA